MDWRSAVIAALKRYSERHGSKVITRQGLIGEELPRIAAETESTGTTPDQTLSRIIQELQGEKFLYFSSRGVYVLIDRPVEAEEEDLPEDAIDFALEAKKLRFGDVAAGESEATQRMRRGQARIRELTLQQYGTLCGFCDISDKRLLVAAHVSRWADDPPGRGDLSNVICMCSFHDALFEYGYFALADDYRVLKRANVSGRIARDILSATESFRPGKLFPPAAGYLEKHRVRSGLTA